jgi:hypothetical protein
MVAVLGHRIVLGLVALWLMAIIVDRVLAARSRRSGRRRSKRTGQSGTSRQSSKTH